MKILIKKHVLPLLIAMAIIASTIPFVGVSAAEDDWVFDVSDNGKEAKITGYVGSDTVIKIPEELAGVKVTAIGNSAFDGNKNITAVEFPDSVIEIGYHAFRGCENLSGVTLPKTLESIKTEAFQNCTSLEKIEIPKSLTDTGNRPFGGSGLKDVTFEEGITKIPDYLFQNCHKLESIVIPDTVTKINACAFENCENLSDVTLSSSLESLGGSAFRGTKSLTAIEIPKSLADCNYFAAPFVNSGLKDITFEEGITLIAEALFEDCHNLEEIEIPETVTEIGVYAFKRCEKIKSIVIPDSVTKIGYNAFEGCTSLSEVTLSNSLETIGGGIFMGCTALESIVIPKTLVNTNYYADGPFKNSGLKDVTFETGVTLIPENLFADSKKLTEIEIPDTVTVIDTYAFRKSGIENIVIPAKVEKIGSSAFEGCSGLKSITFKGKLPKSLPGSLSSLKIPTGVKIYVPACVETSYRSYKEFVALGITAVPCDETCPLCGNAADYAPGYIGGVEPQISGAVEVLKFVAELGSNLIDEEKDPQSYKAALITPESIKSGKPQISDAIEILKFVAGLDSLVVIIVVSN